MNKKNYSAVIILALVGIGVVGISAFALLFQGNQESAILEYDGVKRAVIIDQLYDEIPNANLHMQATNLLEEAGYKVDIFTTKDITVDLYKNLPSMNYNYIIIRTHSATDQDNESVGLFTGEKYQEEKYTSEQLFGHVTRGATIQELTFHSNEKNSDWNIVNDTYREITTPATTESDAIDAYFLITPKLVKDLMIGKFPDSKVLIGGCSALENYSLAQAFIDRGASSVVGWDDLIDNRKNDAVIINFLEENLKNNLDTNEAVKSAMEKNINSSKFNATLIHYPEPNL